MSEETVSKQLEKSNEKKLKQNITSISKISVKNHLKLNNTDENDANLKKSSEESLTTELHDENALTSDINSIKEPNNKLNSFMSTTEVINVTLESVSTISLSKTSGPEDYDIDKNADEVVIEQHTGLKTNTLVSSKELDDEESEEIKQNSGNL